MKQLSEFEASLQRVMNHKPSQKPIDMNPYFIKEFSEYLEAAGFQEHEFPKAHYDLMYSKDDRAILIKNDTIDFMIMVEEEPDERHACLSKYMSFSGFSQLDIFKFMMLLHVTGYVSLKNLINEARKNAETKVHPLFEDIFLRFGFAETKTELSQY